MPSPSTQAAKRFSSTCVGGECSLHHPLLQLHDGCTVGGFGGRGKQHLSHPPPDTSGRTMLISLCWGQRQTRAPLLCQSGGQTEVLGCFSVHTEAAWHWGPGMQQCLACFARHGSLTEKSSEKSLLFLQNICNLGQL